MKESSQPVRKWHLTAAFLILLITTLACGFGGTEEPPAAEEVTTRTSTATPTEPAEVTEPEAAETVEAEPEEQSSPADAPAVVPNPLNGEQREALAAATVFIAMLEDQGDDRFIIGSGSGTLISEDGLILTNAHIAQPSSVGLPPSENPDALGIGIVESTDQPPVPSYLAEVVAIDGLLDLAILRITTTLDGSRVEPAALGLPFVPLGDSDIIRLGDNINIFGFPGIGGETITFTRGSVSGFSSQEQVGNRAWIKTDATIAGGNSGGLATDDFGQLIGIPSRASAGENQLITDCRVVQDTNGDGRLNEADNCVPIGGFINAIRPIKLAMPLIRAAQASIIYESPYITASTNGQSNGQELFTFVTWAEDFDNDGCAINPITSYPAAAELLVAVFSYSGLTEGQEINVYWLLDGEIYSQDQFAWDGGAAGDCLALWFRADSIFEDGEYTILIYTQEGAPLAGEATTVVGAGQFVESGVTVTGRVLDADTGRGVPRATIIILNPGVNVEVWLDNPIEDDIYTYAQADRAGDYTLPRPLARGQRYEGIGFADGYEDTVGYLEFDEGDDDLTVIDIELTR